tara:strand:- start:13 stop:984 length:972 start_codon:yes stop_codon:yes gene_type:complete
MKQRALSGKKYQTGHGHMAIKNGIKQRDLLLPVTDVTSSPRKPPWLRVRLHGNGRFESVRDMVRSQQLATVCEESHCPNISECWGHGTATLMLMGAVCTRACRFCAVDTGNPGGWLDEDEPLKVAESVRRMDLSYVVLTSVDRDDLMDGGASHFAKCVRSVKRQSPKTTVEALTPDFQGKEHAIRTVVESGISVFAQNLETVERLTSAVRDPRAGYNQTLSVLEFAGKMGSVHTKTSLMLGLGELEQEVRQTLTQLADLGVNFLTLGQYLQPTPNHLPIVRWVHPDEFERYRQWALELGFEGVAAGPLVRSSYRADRLVSALS